MALVTAGTLHLAWITLHYSADGLSYEANSDSPEHQLESLCVEPFTPVEAQTSHCVSEPYANPAHTYDVPARIPPIARPLVESATIGEKALPLTTAYDTPFDSYVVPVSEYC